MKEGECRSIFFLLNKLKSKIMQEGKVTKNEKLVLTKIKDTPFQYATNGEKNYIICGKVLLETEHTEEEAKKWLNKKEWEAISLLCQAICNEMLNNKN